MMDGFDVSAIDGVSQHPYQIRWHTYDPAWRRFSFHCHREGKWENNLWGQSS